MPPLSRSTRIGILLAIDSLSAPDLADPRKATRSIPWRWLPIRSTWHSPAAAAADPQLNDVFSLIVALYAVKLAGSRKASSEYSYGWQRAEILGALINGVFLLALCLSIFLEAVQRFFEPQEISNPKLVLIVGCAGLASNLIGLVLFHEHGHGHQQYHGAVEESDSGPVDRGDIESVLPSTIVQSIARPRQVSTRPRSRHTSFASADSIYLHPSQSRRAVIEAAKPDDDVDQDLVEADAAALHSTHKHLLNKLNGNSGKDSHSHRNLNMRGVFLHVMGDFVGNLGVVATALFIWKTDFSWRFYSDPVISLFITAIIFSSALPLCKSASQILLQRVPTGVKLSDVKEDISNIKGVDSVHELHIWQLSDIKMIASVHVMVSLLPTESKEYMTIATAIRTCLHEYGIHSSTIQPEFAGIIPRMHPRIEEVGDNTCLLSCVGGDHCNDAQCC
ncbi:Zinc homeostasis factor 1 [Neolecta irregularis DAH-3]|uniref:Zinc homeostasis factor 1 n=1 Tax=Neolecta irregularis (strain DAH-3) TaxID=1198029 RepID=A0A1U7LJA7_NEOID|nr:Zinc homeostasis factor 1 [Neolecta irregularis DAH-3]|eukprot:OLL22740.1 Zinc homeostasis factor 1 [Neolecta irregularis DAH-3]